MLVKKIQQNYLLFFVSIVTTILMFSVKSTQIMAGGCIGGTGVYVCTGAAGADSTVSITDNPIQVTTNSGFGIDTSGNSFELYGTNGISFIDNFMSNITATLDAIYADNITTAGINISTNGAINAGNNAIDAYSIGTGAISVKSNGILSAGNIAIAAENQIAGTDLSIVVTADATAGGQAIIARNYGSGELTVRSSGTLTANGGEGIIAENYHGSALSVFTGDIIATSHGVSTLNNGFGNTEITSQGTITSGDTGILAVQNNGDSLIINAVAVSGETEGVVAYNAGTGALEINTTASVIGGADDGIDADNYGTDLTINTAAVTGDDDAIDAKNFGTGLLSIKATGSITSVNDNGIYAENDGTNLTIHTASITSGDDGIQAWNDGTGTLSITSTGIITSGEDGIYAENNGTGLTIQTAAISSGDDGIDARNNGSGELSITALGAINSDDDGIYVENDGTDTNIITAAITAEDVAISVAHDSSGELNITTNGLITANSDIAIRLNRAPAGNFGGAITNNAGWISNNSIALEMHSGFAFTGTINTAADITGGGGTAVDASGTTTDFAINQTSGTITGDILFGTGDIIYNITGGEVDGDIISTGTGTVNVDLGTGNTISFNSITNVEDYNIQSGTAIQLGDFSTAGTTTTISQGATLQFNSIINGSGALVSHGNLAFTPGAQLIQTGTVTLENGSTITANLQGTVAPLTQQQYLSATTIVNNGVSFESNSLLYDIEGNIAGNIVQADTVVADLANLSSHYNTSQFGAAMKSYVENGATDSPVVALANLAAGDINGFDQVSNILSPAVSGSINQGSRTIYNENWRALLNHQLTTSINEKDGAWAQVIGTQTDAKKKGNVEGFSGHAKGLTVGFDRQLGEFPSGISLSQGDTALTNKRALDDHADIESTQLSLYSSYQGDNWFAYVNTSAAKLNYEFDRNDTTNTSTKIKAKSKGDLFGVDVSVGFSKIELKNLSMQPLLSIRYSHLTIDDYQESGGLDSKVSYKNSETLSSNLQLHATLNSFTKGSWQITPVAHAGWEHEFINDAEQVNVSFSNQSYQQRGTSGDSNLYNFGMGLQAIHSNGVKLGLQYFGDYSSKSYQHSAALILQYSF